MTLKNLESRKAVGQSFAFALILCGLAFAATNLGMAASVGHPAEKGKVAQSPKIHKATMTPVLVDVDGYMSMAPPRDGAPRPSNQAPECNATTLDQGGLPVLSLVGLQPLAPLDDELPGTCSDPPNDPCFPSAPPAGCGTCVVTEVEVYKNETGPFGFTGCTGTPANCPQYLDDITLGGPLSFPPARFTSVEMGWVVRIGRAAAPGNCFGGPTPGIACTSTAACGAGGNCTTLPAGKTMRVEVSFWDIIDRGAVPPLPVNPASGFLGGYSFLQVGPKTAGFFYLQTIVFPFSGAIAPTHLGELGVLVNFRDDTTNALTNAGSPLFAGTGVSTGSSMDSWWDDDNGDGTYTSIEEFNFGVGAPYLANSYLHIGAKNPTQEEEPNETAATATDTAPCLTLTASISPVGDVDFYKFSISADQTIVSEVVDGSATDTSTLTLSNGPGGANVIATDSGTGSNSITQFLTAAGSPYFLKVNETGNDNVIPSYTIGVGPPPAIVTGLDFAPDKSSISWDPVLNGAPYDIIFGDLQLLHSSGINASVGGCLGDDLPTPNSSDTDTPAPGEGFYYISRSRNVCTNGSGTYDEGGNQIAPRDPLIPDPPVDCTAP